MSENFRLVQYAAVAKWRSTRRSRNGAVVSTTVNPKVWAAAMDAAGGDVTRLVIESPSCVLVLNQRRRKN